MNVTLNFKDIRLLRWCFQVVTSVLANSDAMDENIDLDSHSVIAMIDILDEKIYNQVNGEKDRNLSAHQMQLFDNDELLV